MGVARAPPEFGGSEKRVEKSEIFTALCKHLAIFNVKLRNRTLELKAIIFFFAEKFNVHDDWRMSGCFISTT